MAEVKPEKNSKGIEDENLGVYSELFSAKSSIDGQDGGVVSALLISGLKEGLFDSAVVVLRTNGYNAEATAAMNSEEIRAARGTKYLKVRTTPKLNELIEQGKKRIAVVGTPCEVRVARRIQQNLKRSAPDSEIIILGLFCLENFTRDRLKEETKRLMGIDIDKAEKTQIRHGKFTAQLEGKEYSCRVKDLADAVEKSCHYCKDFTAELADVSFGSAGSQKGYSTVIVRSNAGKNLLKNLEIIRAEAKKEEIVKLSKFKKERARKERA
jgi:coenzyme F420 hydrogenase subunit beta